MHPDTEYKLFRTWCIFAVVSSMIHLVALLVLSAVALVASLL